MKRRQFIFAIALIVAACTGAADTGGIASPSPEAQPTTSPTVPPLVLATLVSSVYPYSLGYPKPWSDSHVATRELVGPETPWIDSDAVDYIGGGEGRTGGLVLVAAAQVPAGTTPESFFDDAVKNVCGEADAQESVDVDGETALLSTFASCYDHFHLWAVVVHGDGAFHIVWLNTPGSEARDRGVFDQILASFEFTS